MKKLTLLAFFLLLISSLFAQKKALSYYLNDNTVYDKNIPTPEDFFGFQIGEQHVSHDQLVAYMRELDRLSDRITLQVVGRTFENRPLMVLTITSPENQKNIEAIRQNHVALTDPSVSATLDVSKMPIVVYQGHSIHGNEASGANAGILAAYHWAAGQGPAVEEVLQSIVILFDPAFNPDGLQRFSQWVNMHRSKNLVTDPASREFSEVWPYGRTNHYWFDLNRDWLVGQQPESRGRIQVFHNWKPNILTDHHEMGSNATFFFMPGEPTRVNPFTPKRNQELTSKIAEFHAKALNKIGSMYYTKQGYDDFYYGKGSTYPDVNGSIGILFEQASSRGHLQRTTNGLLSFAFTIRNQLTASFSTIEAAKTMRVEILNYQREFYKNAADEAKKDTRKAYVFGDKYDPSKVFHFLEIMKRNQIKVYELAQNIAYPDKNGTPEYPKGSSYIIPTDQQQYKLIKASFEKYTEGSNGFFTDSLFYDISSWTLPMAFGLDFKALDGAAFSSNLLGKEITDLAFPTGEIVGGKSDYGYVFAFDDYYSPHLLNSLLKEDLLVKVMAAPSKIESNTEGGKNCDYGTIFLPVQNQSKSSDAIFAILQNAVKKTGVKIYGIKTGLAMDGADMGGPTALTVRKPNVAMLIGEGISNNDAGEIWHLMDTRYDMNLTMIDVANIGRFNLNSYSALIMADGSYSGAVAAKMKEYAASGGTTIAFGRAVRFLKNNDLAAVEFKTSKNTLKTGRRPYSKFEDDEGSATIGGSIFEAEADLTHPLLYGYHNKKMPVFRGDTLFMDLPQNMYSAPLVYTPNPLLSGYLKSKWVDVSKQSPSIIVTASGNGRAICMIDNPNFRAFWYGTNKLMANMIFFGNLIQMGTLESVKTGSRQ
jgi:hypothetical protein